MAKKQLLHPFIGAGANLEVIGWVEVQERKPFDSSAHIEGVALDGLDAACCSGFGSVGVEFDSIERRVLFRSQRAQSGAGAAARVERRGGQAWERETGPEHWALLNRKWVVP
jgi:hypothetical protein